MCMCRCIPGAWYCTQIDGFVGVLVCMLVRVSVCVSVWLWSLVWFDVVCICACFFCVAVFWHCM